MQRVVGESDILWYREELTEQPIKSCANVLTKLKVLRLILTYRHKVRLVEHYISGHEHGVAIQRETGMLVTLGLFIFELDHFVEPAERSHSREEPHHLSMGCNIRLDEECALTRVNATSKKCCNSLQ